MPGYKISAKKRKAIVNDLYYTDKSLRQIARENKISHSTVIRYKNLYKPDAPYKDMSIDPELNIAKGEESLDVRFSKVSIDLRSMYNILDNYMNRITSIEYKLDEHEEEIDKIEKIENGYFDIRNSANLFLTNDVFKQHVVLFLIGSIFGIVVTAIWANYAL